MDEAKRSSLRDGAPAPTGSSVVTGACAVALAAFVVWSVVGEAVRSGSLGPEALDDFAILTSHSRVVAEQGSYGWQLAGEGPVVVFVYSPFAVGLHRALALLGPRAAAVAWMAVLVGASLVCLVLLRGLADADRRSTSALAVVLAVVTTRAYVQSDLHFLNGNVVPLALALGALAVWPPAGAPQSVVARAGALLALSLALKPVALGLLVLPLVTRRFDLFAWTVGLGGALVGLLPVLVLGPQAGGALVGSWLATLRAVMEPGFAPRIESMDISLAASVGSVVGHGAWLVVAVAQGVFALLVALALGRVRDPVRDGAILLLVPLPFSPLLQPHQGVVLLPIAMGLAMVTLDTGAARLRRAVAGVALLVAFGVASFWPGSATRGLALFASWLGLLGAMAVRKRKNWSYR